MTPPIDKLIQESWAAMADTYGKAEFAADVCIRGIKRDGFSMRP